MKQKSLVVKKRDGYHIYSRVKMDDSRELRVKYVGKLSFDEFMNDWMYEPKRFPFIRLGEKALLEIYKLVADLNKHEKQTDFRGMD